MARVAALLGASLLFGVTNAHLAAFHKGMYCLNGPQSAQDLNSYSIVTPLYQLDLNQWWFHHVDRCDQFPPADGDFLDLPAGGQFTVEIASNRAKTTLSYNGRDASDWPDGNTYPEDYNVPTCITSPNFHAQNQSMAAGTAFAISYESDISKVTPDNLAVFTVRYHTPWKRVTTYDVPANMPPCPPGGCICAWGWVPNGCGQPNIYHMPYRCRVTGSKSNTPVAKPKPPVWCEGNPGGCTKGAKQMIYWNQNSGNNIQVSGYDQAGEFKSPAYNSKLGFPDGAQNDIFAGPPSSSTSGGTSTGNSGNTNTGNTNTGSTNTNTNNQNNGSNSNNNNNAGNGNNASAPKPSSIAPPAASIAVHVNLNPPASSSSSSAAPAATDSNATTISTSNTSATNNRAPSCKRQRRRRGPILDAENPAIQEEQDEAPVALNKVAAVAHRRRFAK
ncbi:hypothetical protein CPC08DRAFT_712012, partial [Agrocybe pediades]